MCGIIGVTGSPDAQPVLLEALTRMEYRGYDSAGIALLTEGSLFHSKSAGKITQLKDKLKDDPAANSVISATGIGHTRWATHGAPTLENAHPHLTERVAVVHNGIIENHQTLRQELQQQGIKFNSETDTEVIPLLLDGFLRQGQKPEESVASLLSRLEGAYALAIIFTDHPDLLIGARKGSPLAIGYGKENNARYLGSDALALGPFCSEISYLEEGDMVMIHGPEIHIFNHDGQPVKRPCKPLTDENDAADKGEFAHFMLKEIHEQPDAIARTYNTFFCSGNDQMLVPSLPFALQDVSRVSLVACGTSFYAGLVARHWLETVARIPADVDIASEFRYRRPPVADQGMAVFISQSGETADTLAALRYAQSIGQHTLALVNVAQSSMAMEADGMLHTQAGAEIGVASTKAFTTQLVALACLTLALARAKETISTAEYDRLGHELGRLPELIQQTLALDPALRRIAEDLKDVRDMFYIGRGTSFAIAHEGALKMKEISYIHAEAYAAGELKHGPLALIADDVPVVVIAPRDELFDKTASNLQETAARGGNIILLSNREGIAELKDLASNTLEMPDCDPFLSPILYTIPLQLLAYHTAVLRGTDVDQPRNLAKSVTVE